MSEEKKEESKSKEIIIEPEEQEKPSRLQYYANQLEDLAGDTTFTNYKSLVLRDSYDSESNEGIPITYKSRKLKPNERGVLRRLINEGQSINKRLTDLDKQGNGNDKEYDKLWDQYLGNIHKQGNLLIKDLTDEQFENSDFYVLENLIVAWRMKYQGFRKL